MRYRRAFLPGGSFFFTVVTEQRRPLFACSDAMETLREAFRVVQAHYPFRMDAVVVLPDHLHCIWTLPPDDADFATRWRLIKTRFTKNTNPALRRASNSTRVEKHEQSIWQHRYWEHQLRNDKDFIRHVEYIHYNPVKHGHATTPLDWPFSSFRRYVKAGICPANWGCGAMEFDGIGSE